MWHSLWDKTLGQPLGDVTIAASLDGTYRREFENGSDGLTNKSDRLIAAALPALGARHHQQNGLN